MQIHFDQKIRKKFHSGFERTIPVTCVVIHGTGGPNTLKWMRKVKKRSNQGKRYLKGIALFHYLICRDGAIWNIIDPNRWVHHASIGHRDEATIGIELINNTSGNMGKYTADQYRSLFWLFNSLYEENRSIHRIISHNLAKLKVHGEGKVCPGPFFDWDALHQNLKQKWDFESGEEYIFNLVQSS